MSGKGASTERGQQASLKSLQLKLNLDVDDLEDVRKRVLAACSS
jgi:hypothetical protein